MQKEQRGRRGQEIFARKENESKSRCRSETRRRTSGGGGGKHEAIVNGTRAVAEERAAPVVPEELHAVPVSIADVNSKNLLGYASDLGPDHPGFHDEEYKRRRTEIVEIALDHQLYVTLTHINTLCTCMDKTLRVICRARCTHICAFFPAQPFSDARACVHIHISLHRKTIYKHVLDTHICLCVCVCVCVTHEHTILIQWRPDSICCVHRERATDVGNRAR